VMCRGRETKRKKKKSLTGGSRVGGGKTGGGGRKGRKKKKGPWGGKDRSTPLTKPKERNTEKRGTKKRSGGLETPLYQRPDGRWTQGRGFPRATKKNQKKTLTTK